MHMLNLRAMGVTAISITSLRRMIDSGAAVEQHVETEFLEKETEEPCVRQEIPWFLGWISTWAYVYIYMIYMCIYNYMIYI